MKKLIFLSYLISVAFMSSALKAQPNAKRAYKGKIFNGTWLSDWALKDRQAWYLTPQGSQFIPFGVFMSLVEKNEDGKIVPFYENLQNPGNSYGFVYPKNKETLELFTQNIEGDYGRLPIGLVQDRDADKKNFVGFTCAACHTGEIRHKGKQYLVDASSSHLELSKFMKDLRNTLKDNLENNDLRKAFIENYLNTPANWAYGEEVPVASTQTFKQYRKWRPLTRNRHINSQLKGALETVSNFYNHNIKEGLAPLPGRLDAVTAILNEVLGTDLNIPQNRKAANAPVSIPHIWDAPIMDCVQTNCLSTNPLTRNIGEVFGVFGHLDLNPGLNDASKKFDWLPNLLKDTILSNSVKVDNLAYKLEHSLESLTSPTWPEEFGSIDEDQWKRGQTLYTQKCAGCHALVEKNAVGEYILNDHNSFKNTFRIGLAHLKKQKPTEYDSLNHNDRKIIDDLSQQSEDKHRILRIERKHHAQIGTDDQFMKLHGGRTAQAGFFEDLIETAVSQNPNVELLNGIQKVIKKDPNQVPALLLLGVSTAVISKEHFKKKGLTPIQQAKASNFRSSPTKVSQIASADYKARPLNGIAFTAPYLHNGSVPNLMALLTKDTERPKSFYVGNKNFDPVHVGFENSNSDPNAKKFLVTQDGTKNTPIVPGNSNLGHSGIGENGEDYGTELSHQQKLDLIVFLKTL